MPLDTKQSAAHARELAARTIAILGNCHLVEDFLDSYLRENDRQGLVDEPARRRELLDTLTREALLAMFARAQAQLPAHLTRRRPAVLTGAEVRVAEVFRQEAVAALARGLRWGPEEVEEFRRDLDLYLQMGARQPAVAEVSRMLGRVSAPPALRASSELREGPFVDRAALLLDPSLMEKARRAAAKFLRELEALADQSLASSFRFPAKRR